jgi:hypothetical protein
MAWSYGARRRCSGGRQTPAPELPRISPPATLETAPRCPAPRAGEAVAIVRDAIATAAAMV